MKCFLLGLPILVLVTYTTYWLGRLTNHFVMDDDEDVDDKGQMFLLGGLGWLLVLLGTSLGTILIAATYYVGCEVGKIVHI